MLPLIDYGVHYEYIAQNLCINKSKPQLHCNGKCHLKNQLAQAADTSDKSNSSDKKSNSVTDEVLYFHQIEILKVVQTYFIYKKPIGDGYSNHYFHLNSVAFFHPPA
jgi:hypothetical protein